MAMSRALTVMPDAKLEVLKAVVRAIAVLVMDRLVALERSSEVARHDEPVLEEVAPATEATHRGELVGVDPHPDVAVSASRASALPLVSERPRACTRLTTYDLATLERGEDSGMSDAEALGELLTRRSAEVQILDFGVLLGVERPRHHTRQFSTIRPYTRG